MMEHYLIIGTYLAAFLMAAGLILWLSSYVLLYGERELSNMVDTVFGYGEQIGVFGMAAGAVMFLIIIPLTFGTLLVQALAG